MIDDSSHCPHRARAEKNASPLPVTDGKFDFVHEDAYLPPGADRQDRKIFEKQQEQHFRAIHRKVLQDRWIFSPFLEKSIPKIAGGERIISLATIRDTLVQRRLYEYLYPIVDPLLSDACCAYRRGSGAHNAIKQIRNALDAGYVHVLDADIKSFFDRVDHETLLAIARDLPIDERALRLLQIYLTTPRVTSEDRRKADSAKPRTKYSREPRTLGIPQGGVISGMLANLLLASFDKEMQQGEDILVRYADDFLVCCQTEQAANDADVRAAHALDALGGLELHPDKTAVRDATDGVDFVGFRIGRGFTRVRSANLAKFKKGIREVIDTHKPKTDSNWDLRRLSRRLSYKIQGPIDEIRKHNLAKHPHHRSWIGFYRIVDDEKQIKNLDRWIREQISRYVWQQHHKKVTAKHMREAGLPSLYGTLWKARKPPESA
ncbi:Retron-type reverse transcriptase (plasmid) [Thioflavicoccus mobilis 8321]|uniref:Retron-type reverse transcriptase n=1 Tax=Thioflavicoccus mobilis 8321 TaxID=765912 RepID=L0H2H6_9GAMM|nr:reverse transcriptase domain-containing protein [Thioflavicoccus mobilis]AGA92426.1 Retron-type reverse transcriptase [Thioflavicoccus mobilis 8321]